MHGIGRSRLAPAPSGPQRQQLLAQRRSSLLAQHLAVEPVELVPVEAGACLVHPRKAEGRSCLLQGEALAHALRRRPAQQGHVVGQGSGRVAHGPEIADGGHAVALGELLALLVEDQRRVGKERGGVAKGLVEQQLLGGVGDVVLAADHVADRHGRIVDHHHQVVEGIADLVGRGAAGDHHVAAQVAAAPAHVAAHQVAPADRAAVVDAEADHRFAALGDEGLLLLRGEIAVPVVVAGGLLAGGLLLAHGGELGLAGVAAVGVARIEQLLDGGAVQLHPLALDHGVAVPVQAQPLQALEDVGGVFRFAALFVGVFDAQQEGTAAVAGKQPVEHRRAGRADVQGASWTGGQAHADWTPWIGLSCHRWLS